jgi:hypothetical protein
MVFELELELCYLVLPLVLHVIEVAFFFVFAGLFLLWAVQCLTMIFVI